MYSVYWAPAELNDFSLSILIPALVCFYTDDEPTRSRKYLLTDSFLMIPGTVDPNV